MRRMVPKGLGEGFDGGEAGRQRLSVGVQSLDVMIVYASRCQRSCRPVGKSGTWVPAVGYASCVALTPQTRFAREFVWTTLGFELVSSNTVDQATAAYSRGMDWTWRKDFPSSNSAFQSTKCRAPVNFNVHYDFEISLSCSYSSTPLPSTRVARCVCMSRQIHACIGKISQIGFHFIPD